MHIYLLMISCVVSWGIWSCWGLRPCCSSWWGIRCRWAISTFSSCVYPRMAAHTHDKNKKHDAITHSYYHKAICLSGTITDVCSLLWKSVVSRTEISQSFWIRKARISPTPLTLLWPFSHELWPGTCSTSILSNRAGGMVAVVFAVAMKRTCDRSKATLR